MLYVSMRARVLMQGVFFLLFFSLHVCSSSLYMTKNRECETESLCGSTDGNMTSGQTPDFSPLTK